MDPYQAVCFLSLVVSVLAFSNRTAFLDYINEIPDEEDEVEPKIVNGRPAEPNEFPFTVALHYNGRFICTAFIIAPTLVMTAAHCVELRDNGAEPAGAFYGIVGNVLREGPETRIDFSEVVTNPDYGQSRGETGDIALFRTTQTIPYSDSIQPICLASQGREFEKEEVTAVGWGLTSTTAREPPETLMTTQLRVQERWLCQLFFTFLGVRITEKHICASSKQSTGVCFGDSGGPLVYQDPESNTRISIGIAAFITPFGCGRRFAPNVYTAVSQYNDFIIEQVGQDSGVCFV